jgi:hypothetical protein
MPSRLGSIVGANGLPNLPSMDHGEVLRGFFMRCFPWKKNISDVRFVRGQVAQAINKPSMQCFIKSFLSFIF